MIRLMLGRILISLSKQRRMKIDVHNFLGEIISLSERCFPSSSSRFRCHNHMNKHAQLPYFSIIEDGEIRKKKVYHHHRCHPSIHLVLR